MVIMGDLNGSADASIDRFSQQHLFLQNSQLIWSDLEQRRRKILEEGSCLRVFDRYCPLEPLKKVEGVKLDNNLGSEYTPQVPTSLQHMSEYHTLVSESPPSFPTRSRTPSMIGIVSVRDLSSVKD